MVVMSEVMLRTLTVFSLFPGAGGASMLAGLMAWCGDDLRSTGVVGLGCRHLPTSPAVARSPVESFYVVDNVGCPVCGCRGAVSGSKKQAAGCPPLGCHGTQYNITYPYNQSEHGTSEYSHRRSDARHPRKGHICTTSAAESGAWLPEHLPH
jgi:hypothetical protein